MYSSKKRPELVQQGPTTRNSDIDMAAKTGNKKVSETVADSVKIPTANSAFWTMTNSIKV